MSNATSSRASAWRNVTIITALFCLIFGVPNLVILATRLPRVMELRPAAGWLSGGCALSGLILLGLMIAWMRRAGRTPGGLGWLVPTRAVAIAVGVVFASAWLGLCYWNNKQLSVEFAIAEISLLRVWAALCLVFAGGVVEEFGMRGVVMSELRRASVPTWLQILASAFCFALYHSLQFLGAPAMFVGSMIASMLMGSVFAGIYVLGGRSLTPCILSHGLINLVGEPYILMGAMAAMSRL